MITWGSVPCAGVKVGGILQVETTVSLSEVDAVLERRNKAVLVVRLTRVLPSNLSVLLVKAHSLSYNAPYSGAAER
jgi:hypothetical protein